MIVIYSNDINLISKNNLIRNKNYSHIIFNNNYDEIENSINSYSLFGIENSYIIWNCEFLKKINDDIINFINNINNDNIILITKSENIDLKNLSKIKNIKIEHIPELNFYTMKKYIDNLVNIYKLKILNINYLYSFFIPDSKLIDNEIQKLFLLNVNIIDDSIIDKILFNYSKDNIFNLIILFLNKDYMNLFLCLDNLIFKGYKIENIVSIISGQLFNIKLYISIYKKNSSLNAICNKLNIEEYKIKKFYNIIKEGNLIKINNLLLQLYEVEKRIKTNNDSYFEIKKFFLEE